MKRKITLIALLTVFLFSTSSFASEDKDLSVIKSGKSVVREFVDKNTNKAGSQLIFMVNSTPEKIWETLTDYEHYTEFMPTMREIKVKARGKNSSIVFIKLESPPLMDISYTLKRAYKKDDWEISFKKIDGKIKDIEGSWKLEPIDDKSTKVTYTTRIDIGIPVPGFILDFFSKNGLNKMSDNIRKRVESGGTWKQK